MTSTSPTPPPRTLIISDIHGCYDELEDLLDKAGLTRDDQILAIGDLLDRGPQPRKVLKFFLHTPNARSLRGNHEQKHLNLHANSTKAPAPSQLITRWLLDDKYAAALKYFNKLPLFADLPDAVVVHGYFEPGVPLREQRADVLVGMSAGERYIAELYPQPWYAQYSGGKPLIVGHRDYTGTMDVLIHEVNNTVVYGIDTRCVYGGALTGLLLPDFRLVSVPARAEHWQMLAAQHGVQPW